MAVKTITIRTAADGSYTWARAFAGKILGVAVEIGDLSTPDIDITDPDHTKTFLSVDGVAADTVYHLGEALVSSAGAAIDALSTSDTVGAYTEPVCFGTLTVAVTGGGDTKRGTIRILYQ